MGRANHGAAPDSVRYPESGSTPMEERSDRGKKGIERIRVLVADDEETVLEVPAALIATDPSLALIGTAKDAEGAIEVARTEFPDVALLDVRMPGGGGQRATREIRRRSPSTRVISLSAHEDWDTVLSMLRAGRPRVRGEGGFHRGDPEGHPSLHEGRSSISQNVATGVAMFPNL